MKGIINRSRTFPAFVFLCWLIFIYVGLFLNRLAYIFLCWLFFIYVGVISQINRSEARYVKRIEMCPNDCIAYWDSKNLPEPYRHSHRTKCPVCNEPRTLVDPTDGTRRAAKVHYTPGPWTTRIHLTHAHHVRWCSSSPSAHTFVPCMQDQTWWRIYSRIEKTIRKVCPHTKFTQSFHSS